MAAASASETLNISAVSGRSRRDDVASVALLGFMAGRFPCQYFRAITAVPRHIRQHDHQQHHQHGQEVHRDQGVRGTGSAWHIYH